MNKEFIFYKLSLELKELGFDEDCFKYYNEEGTLSTVGLYYTYDNPLGFKCLAPLYQQTFKFFREKYNLQCWPEPTGSDRYSCRYDGNDDIGKRYVGYLRDNLNNILFYKTYEEAELECLIKLIKIVKHEKNSNIKL